MIHKIKSDLRTLEWTDALVKALTDLCDEIGANEEHGDGADDTGCQVCRSHKRARKVLASIKERA